MLKGLGVGMLVLFRVVGALYLVSGLWCGLQLEAASSFLGFSIATPTGYAEFFSVYGGLQIGLGLAMLITSAHKHYVEASIYFSAIFSSCLALFRLISFGLYGFLPDFVVMLILELMIALVLWWAWSKQKSSH